MDEVECLKCHGTGREEYEDDGRPVSDVCYRCAGQGRVDPDTAHRTLMERLCAVLAGHAVAAERAARNADPEGENWAFCAAENMMTEYEYTQGRQYDRAAEFAQELSKLKLSVQEALIEAVLER